MVGVEMDGNHAVCDGRAHRVLISADIQRNFTPRWERVGMKLK